MRRERTGPEVNNALDALRSLNATYDSNNKGRQRVRMQYRLQPRRSESTAQTTEAVERWEWDVTDYEERFGKGLDENVNIGVILALALPSGSNHSHLNSHVLKSYSQGRRCCSKTVEHKPMSPLQTTYQWIYRFLEKGKRGKGDTKGKGKGKGTGEDGKDEKGKGKKGRGEGRDREDG